LAAAMSPTSPDCTAPERRARDSAMLVKMVDSCRATPFTVSTRLGTRSARRWSWASICPLAWLTVSSIVWIVL
jgi:hypothetical protein